MTDLVERLRRRNNNCPECNGSRRRSVGPDQDGRKYNIACGYCEDRDLAADEIERLTAEVARLNTHIRAGLSIWDGRTQEMHSDAEVCRLIVPILNDAVSGSRTGVLK